MFSVGVKERNKGKEGGRKVVKHVPVRHVLVRQPACSTHYIHLRVYSLHPPHFYLHFTHLARLCPGPPSGALWLLLLQRTYPGLHRLPTRKQI